MRIAILLAGVMLAAAMNVAHATTLLVGVDPETGESKFFIASGVGKVSKSNTDESGTTVPPNQQVSLDNPSDGAQLPTSADLENLIANTSNAIIDAIIASKAAIDQENAAYIANKLQSALGEASNQEAIDRINKNLDNLIGNIVNNAISQNKVSKEEIQGLIDKINQQLDKKLDLDNVKPAELSAQEKAKQAQIKLLEAERKKKQNAEKLKQEQLKKQNEELQKKLKEQLEKQKVEKAKAAEAAKKKAAEEHAKKLTDAAAKAAFEAKQKALAEEKQKQALAKQEEEARKSAAPTPPQQTAGTGSQSGTPSDADPTAGSGSGDAAGQSGNEAGQDGVAGAAGAGVNGDGGAGGQAALGGLPVSGGGQGGDGGAGGQVALGGQPGSGGGQGGDGGAGGQAALGGQPGSGAGQGAAAGGPPGIDPKQLTLVGGNKLNQSQQQLAKSIDRLKEGLRVNTSGAPGDGAGDLLGRIQALIDFLRQMQEDEVNHMRAANTPPSGGSSAGNQPSGADGRYDPNAPLDTEWLRQLVNGGTLPPLTLLALADVLREVMAGLPDDHGSAPLNGDRDADQAAKDKLLRDFVEQIAALDRFPYIEAGHVSIELPTESLRGEMTATYNGHLSGAFVDGTEVGGSMRLVVDFNHYNFTGQIDFSAGNGGASITDGSWDGALYGGFSGEAYGGVVTGEIRDGKFYGPQGQEIGGNWQMYVEGDGARAGHHANGQFATKQ